MDRIMIRHKSFTFNLIYRKMLMFDLKSAVMPIYYAWNDSIVHIK